MSSGGTSPCHLSVNDKENMLYVANYGGSFAAFSLQKESGELLLGQSNLGNYCHCFCRVNIVIWNCYYTTRTIMCSQQAGAPEC